MRQGIAVSLHDAAVARRTAIRAVLKTLAEHQSSASDMGSGAVTFSDIITNAERLLECSESDLARQLDVSRPTIARWKQGSNLPPQLTLEAVIRRVENLLKRKLRLIK